tara:strand:- start:315 stop:500 length:186 start_codon:yes stop_codon:yes gene_type:complete
MTILRIIYKRIIPKQPILGRWSLKHDFHKCEKYILNYYGEPGYPNNYKQNWLDKLKTHKKS